MLNCSQEQKLSTFVAENAADGGRRMKRRKSGFVYLNLEIYRVPGKSYLFCRS